MKKILFLFPVILFVSCDPAHLESPLIVTGVSVNENDSHKEMYEVKFSGKCERDANYYTDTKYNVGDTLK